MASRLNPELGTISKAEQRYIDDMKKVDGIYRTISLRKLVAWRKEIVVHHRDWKAGRVKALRRSKKESV
ncbi:TPA: hypothetical protein ACX6NV_002032 [Photobacterium damselae]